MNNENETISQTEDAPKIEKVDLREIETNKTDELVDKIMSKILEIK